MTNSLLLTDQKIKYSVPCSNCNRQITDSQAFQLAIALDPLPQSEPIATIEPAGYWPDRWLIQIKDCDLTWKIVPCLRRSEVEAVLSTLRLMRVDLSLDQNEGTPIKAREINQIVELYLDRVLVQGGAL